MKPILITGQNYSGNFVRKNSSGELSDRLPEILTPSARNAYTRSNPGIPVTQFPQLHLLSASLADRTNNPKTDILSVETLEIFEAELRNQGLLPEPDEYNGTLAQQLHNEINLWQWRARRAGVDARTLAFKIQLADYVLEKAKELLIFAYSVTQEPSASSLERPGNFWCMNYNGRNEIHAKLTYLEHFAAYLNGVHEQSENRYRQALNLLLKSLSTRATAAENPEATKITLPIDPQKFSAVIYTQSEK